MKTRVILYAEDGCMLTDGNVYCRIVYLAVDADASVWREIPEREVPQEEEII